MATYEFCEKVLVYFTIEADSEEEAEELALSGDYDYMMRDCDDWSIEETIEVKNEL